MNQELRAQLGAPPEPGAAWRALYAQTCAPYRRASRFAWHFARGKLRHDPAFRGMLERGDLSPAARVLDIGCGQGLLASLLQACADVAAQGRWPATWPPAPRATHYTGIELMPTDVQRARAAVGELPLRPRFVCADLRQALLPECDLVVILDVLHYVNPAAQVELLQRVRLALGAHGRLLLRVGDRSAQRRIAVSQWVDWLVTTVRGHCVPTTWCRNVADWTQLLQSLGFAVGAVPMSRGTPFANVLLVADVQAQAT